MLIELQAISKIYPMGAVSVHALDRITLNVAQGEFISIMGASGSGKTTLLDIIGCLSQPTSGEYIFNGTSVSSLPYDRLASIRNQSIGFIFQTFHLLPRQTALMNVALPLFYNGILREERMARAKEALERVGLSHRIEHLPRMLSGGQQQRVAIARALVNRPQMILADEPTGNLDSKSGTEIINLLSQLHQNGQTVILVTHDVEIAKRARRSIVLKDGMIVQDRLIG